MHVCQLRIASTSLTDRSSQLTTLQRDVELQREKYDSLEENLQQEKVGHCYFFKVLFCLSSANFLQTSCALAVSKLMLVVHIEQTVSCVFV